MLKRDDGEHGGTAKTEMNGEVTAVEDGIAPGAGNGRAPASADNSPPGSTEAQNATAKLRDGAGGQAYLHVALMVLFGSTTAPAARYIVDSLPLLLIPVLRFGLACLCLVPVVWVKGGLGRLIRQDGWRLVLAAVLCVPVNQAFFLCATKLGLTSHVGLFYATTPLVVLLLAWGFRMEHPDFGRLSGVLLSVAGIVVIGFGHYLEQGSHRGAAAQSVVLSDLLLLGAVVSWGSYIVVSKPLIQRHGAMTVLAGTVLAGFVLAVPFAFLQLPSFASLARVPASAWLGLLFLGLFITPFAWAYQNLALRNFDASEVATFSNASPILTVVWGMWLFGEVLTPTLVAGGAMTLGGIYWACRPRRAPSPDQGALRKPLIRRPVESSDTLPPMPGLALTKKAVSR